MGLLDNKVCVITGGAGSVGLASAQAFLREGAKVMIVDLQGRRPHARREGAQQPERRRPAPPTSPKTADVKAYLDATVKKFGKIDVLFSNAGNSGVVTPVTEYPEDVFDSVIAVHIRRGIPRLQVWAAADERRGKHHHHLLHRRREG